MSGLCLSASQSKMHRLTVFGDVWQCHTERTGWTDEGTIKSPMVNPAITTAII